MGRQTASGFAWLLLQTFSIKIATIAGQVILAWLLAPKDFGLVALTYSVVSIISILQSSGPREILIQREREFSILAAPAFWLSVAVGALVSVMIVAAAPWVVRIYQQPELLGLLLVMAVFTFIGNLEHIPTAKLQNQMRFRALSIIGILQGVGQISLSVVLAAQGFGAYSFILPLPIVAVVKIGVLWYLARPPLSWNPGLRHWPSIAGSSGLLIAAAFFIGINLQGTQMILGVFHSATVVGIFFFAHHLAQQIHTLLALNLSQVLLPSFSKLQETPRRQHLAFLRANKLLMILASPASFLVAALAAPGIRLVFDPRWTQAIPVVQALAIGTAFTITTTVTLSFLTAQGRYRLHLGVAAFRSVFFLGLVTLAANKGGVVEVGIVAALGMGIAAPLIMYVSIRAAGFGWREIWQVYASPIAAAAVACGAGALTASLVPALPAREAIQVGVTTLIAGLLYVGLIRALAPTEWQDLIERGLEFIPSRWHSLIPLRLLAPEFSPAGGNRPNEPKTGLD